MTNNIESDLALSALLAAALEVNTTITEDLIKRSYAIQRSHQFDREENRATSLQELQNLVDIHLDTEDVK